MSIYFVEQPSRRLKIRAPVRLDISREDACYVFPHITGNFMEIMMMVPLEGVYSSPEYSGIYKYDSREVSEGLEQLVKAYVRKLMLLGCFLQNLKYVITPEKGSVIPFTGMIKLVPSVLFPIPFPLTPFRAAVHYMPSLVRLIDNISCNVKLLSDMLSQLRGVDPFISKLLDLFDEIYVSGRRNINDDIRAYVIRADYLLNLTFLQQNADTSATISPPDHCKACHYDICLCELRTVVGGSIGSCCDVKKGFDLLPGVSMKMVEVNTMSCFGMYTSEMVSRAQKECVESMMRGRVAVGKMDHISLISGFRKLHLHNTPVGGIVDTLATAHEHYVKRYCSVIDDTPPCILQVVTEDLANFFDLYVVADALFENYGIVVKVASMKDLCIWRREGRLFLRPTSEPPTRFIDHKKHTPTRFDKLPGRLYHSTSPLNGTSNDIVVTEISVIYYRSCYSESQMDVDKDSWEVRTMLEYSDAVKVPSIPAQLAGCKRVQLLLSGDVNHESFGEESVSHEQSPSGAIVMSREDTLATFKNINVLQVDPSLPDNLKVIHDALANPDKYVLKSQSEGQSDLLVGESLVAKLNEALSIGLHNLSDYVLMQKIKSPLQKAMFINVADNGSFKPEVEKSITEVGIYGCSVISGKRVLMEECSGYMARTKRHYIAGGGVSAGCASMSSLLFF